VKIYIVQLGDSLYKIAQKHGVSLEDLTKLNTQLADPDNIKPGMKIKVPSDSKYVKKKVKADKIIKESPKKEMINKKMPVKENAIKENPVKENVVEKKPVMEVKKKEPAKKKLKESAKENPIKGQAVEKKPIMKAKKKEPMKEIVKLEKEPAEKEKIEKQLEENQLPMMNSKVIEPIQPANNEALKQMKAKEEQVFPMMEDPYPNAMMAKESVDSTHEGKWKFSDPGMGMPSESLPNNSTTYEQGHHPYFHQQAFNNSSQSGKMKMLNQSPQPYYPFAENSQAHYHQGQPGMGNGGYAYPNAQSSHLQQGVGYSVPDVPPQIPASQQGMSSGSYGYGYASIQPPQHPQHGMMHGGYGHPNDQNGWMQGSGEHSFPDVMPAASQPTQQMPHMGVGGQIPGAYGYPMSQAGQGQSDFSTLQPPSGLTELPHRDENPYSLWESYHHSINIPDFPKKQE